MASVTVAGANGSLVTIQLGQTDNLLLAQQLAAQVTQSVQSGAAVTYTDVNGIAPPVPDGKIGEVVESKPGFAILNPQDTEVVVSAASATVFGGGGANETVLAGSGNLTFFAGTGSGTILTGNGNNLITETPGSGPWSIYTGTGNDTIQAIGSSNFISTGGGHNEILLGSGSDTVS